LTYRLGSAMIQQRNKEGYLKGGLKVGNIKVNHEGLGKLCYFPLGRAGSYIEAKLVEVYFAGKTGDFVGVGEVEGNCIPVEANIENILVKD
jgi:hypothetical protein